MTSYNYLDTPNVNLVCCICRSPFLDPCTARTCSHTFCYDCISHAIAVNRQCPIDRTPLSLHDLAPADPVIRNLVDELIVICPNEHLGCSYTCQRLLLPIHLTDTCQYVQVACPDGNCTARILKRDVEKHRCHETVPREAAQAERQRAEPANDTSQTEATPNDDAHVRPRLSTLDLAAENAILRLRLLALENVVHELRGEMFAVKHALGPWYRPEVQPQFHADTPVEPPLATGSQVFEESATEVTQLQGVMQDSEASSTGPPTDPSDLASYFPSPEENITEVPVRPRRSRAVTDATSTRYMSPSTGPALAPTSPPASYATAFPTASTPGFGPSAIHTPGSYAPPSSVPGISFPQTAPLATTPAATLSIPPLDPTTPLPDTLASLHSSLVTLAGALGALAAARGSESLRTAEEIRGLRAAMHGLRMQVHDILTSRTHHPGQTAGGPASADAEGLDAAHVGMGAPSWTGYGPRPYGQFPMYPHSYPPPHLGMPHAPPTNITKL
ncbi:hypothetical protein BV20DRAFT_942559 [Pilatotrama ljubarskyi]|nr:hypothetical protein BV20DRAFT_942559 [Pilatotrama ljubarskyi]